MKLNLIISTLFVILQACKKKKKSSVPHVKGTITVMLTAFFFFFLHRVTFLCFLTTHYDWYLKQGTIFMCYNRSHSTVNIIAYSHIAYHFGEYTLYTWLAISRYSSCNIDVMWQSILYHHMPSLPYRWLSPRRLVRLIWITSVLISQTR
jgi:hypothetical protein